MVVTKQPSNQKGRATKKNLIAAGLVVIVALSALLISYELAKGKAIAYLDIIKIRDEASFQVVKHKIYPIASPEVRRLVFDKKHYEGASYPPVEYNVNDVRGKVVGFNRYEFTVTWSINSNQAINSILEVDNGVVVDVRRVDLE